MDIRSAEAGSSRRALPLPRALGTTFQSLENPAFARYFYGTTAFFFAMNMQILLRSWLVWELTDDPLALGLINAAFAIPTLLLSPVGGVVADRFDRRTVIVVSQTAQLVLTIATTVLVLAGIVTYWELLLLSFLAAAASAFNMPARQAIVPELVGREGLMNAIALSSGSMNVSRIAAPALAGILVAPIGVGGGFVVTLVFYTLAVVLFARVRGGNESRPERTGFFREMAEGVSYVRRTRVMLLLLVVGTVPMLLAMPQQILLPAFTDIFHVGAAGVGVMQAAAGCGGLTGAIIAANIGRPKRPALLMLTCMLGFGGFVIGFALSPHLAPALLALAAGDLAAMLCTTVNNTVVQEIVPDGVRGRVMALMMMSFGLTPLGVLPASAAASAFGVQPTVAAGGLILITFALALYLLSRTFRSLDMRLQRYTSARPRPLSAEE
jgi:MFS family permease